MALRSPSEAGTALSPQPEGEGGAQPGSFGDFLLLLKNSSLSLVQHHGLGGSRVAHREFFCSYLCFGQNALRCPHVPGALFCSSQPGPWGLWVLKSHLWNTEDAEILSLQALSAEIPSLQAVSAEIPSLQALEHRGC